MSIAKLHINLEQGALDVEGDVNFVREVYKDYREALLAKPEGSLLHARNGAEIDGGAAPKGGLKEANSTKRKRKPPSTKATKEGGPGISSYKPMLAGGLDTMNIKTFLAGYEPKNHQDNIVLFVLYLESKGVSPASFDQIYTCYRDAQVKTPVAFAQAFIDARGNKKGFIEFADPTNVSLTERGRNHGQFGGIKKKGSNPA